MKNKKEVKFRHRCVIKFARIVVKPILVNKWKYTYKKCDELGKKQPFLVIANHSIDLDPLFIQLSFKKALYFVGSEQLLKKSFKASLLKWAVNPIGKKKAVADMDCVRKINKIVKEGGSICIMPEGNCTYSGSMSNINDSIAKLVKMLKIPLVIFKINGFYFQRPRWSATKKKGPGHGEVSEIIYPEEIANMRVEEIYERIMKAFEKDVYDYQDEHKLIYKGKDLALGLERLGFMCLKCGSFNMKTKNDRLYCADCADEHRYTNQGYLVDRLEVEMSLKEFETRVKNSLINYLNGPTTFEFKDEVKIYDTSGNKNIFMGKGMFIIKRDELKIVTHQKIIQLPLHDVIAMSVYRKDKLLVYLENDTYVVEFLGMESPYKYLMISQYYRMAYKDNNKKITINDLGLE